MLTQNRLDEYPQENYTVYDRFTFDKVFRTLLLNGYEREEAKDIILHNCTLSALVLQERIHNGYYHKIFMNEEISGDLIEFRNEIAEKIMTLKGKEYEHFCNYLKDKRADVSDKFQRGRKLVTENDFSGDINNLCENKTYRKTQTIYGQLQQILGVEIEPAPDEWDRLFNVDFFIKINDKFIGLQIKPAGYAFITQIINERQHQLETHKKFTSKYGGKVFYIISVKDGDKKRIYNTEVIEEIKSEIEKLKS